MNETQWQACKDPVAMLDELGRLNYLAGRPKPGAWKSSPRARKPASARQIRLFLCGCARLVWHVMPEVARQAVETVERAAEGEASAKELKAAKRAVEKTLEDFDESEPEFYASHVAFYLCWPESEDELEKANLATVVVDDVSGAITEEAGAQGGDDDDPVQQAADQSQCALCRDVFPNPYRPLQAMEQSSLDWNDRTVVRIAERIYSERAFDLLPILGDALEEAGCNDPQILAHTRQPGSHARGCWVLDLILEK